MAVLILLPVPFIKNWIAKEIWDYFFFYFFAFFAVKITSVDRGVYKRFTGKNKPIFFRIFGNRIKTAYLPAPVDTEVFNVKDKDKARKKLHHAIMTACLT